MKLKVIDRIFLLITSLISLAAAVLSGSIIYGKEFLQKYVGFVLFGSEDITFWVLCGALALFVIIAILLFEIAVRRVKRKDKNSVTVQHAEQGNGEVRVSVQALDSLVKQSIANHSEGVADIKTRILNHEDSISLRVDMSLESDVHIPNATMLLQDSIKNYIEEYSGIAVRDISIMVTSIVPNPAQLKLNPASETRLIVDSDGENNPKAVLEPHIEAVAAEQEKASYTEEYVQTADGGADTGNDTDDPNDAFAEDVPVSEAVKNDEIDNDDL